MPFKEPKRALQDIVDAIEMIEQFSQGVDVEGLRQDPKTTAAIERKLQVISEAAIRLGDGAEELCPDQPWRNIRGIGNWLRHQYDRIDLETVWLTITDDLPRLRDSVRRALKLPSGGQHENE